MAQTSIIPNSAGARAQVGSDASQALASVQYALVATRPRRITALLVLLWILNVFDLSCTILAHQIGGFQELNPVARQMLEPSWMLVAFKVGTVALGSLILLLLRRYRVTELVCWLLCLIYTSLAFTWMTYFSLLG
jgi:uncharacterized protein DUF5658